MPYVAWNDGASVRWFDEGEARAPQPGERILGADWPTEDDLAEAFGREKLEAALDARDAGTLTPT